MWLKISHIHKWLISGKPSFNVAKDKQNIIKLPNIQFIQLAVNYDVMGMMSQLGQVHMGFARIELEWFTISSVHIFLHHVIENL